MTVVMALIVTLSFWAAVAMLAFAGLLVVWLFVRYSSAPITGGRVLIQGLGVAVILVSLPGLMSADVFARVLGVTHRSGVMDYVGALSPLGLWVAAAAVVVWVSALVATLALVFLRRRRPQLVADDACASGRR